MQVPQTNFDEINRRKSFAQTKSVSQNDIIDEQNNKEKKEGSNGIALVKLSLERTNTFMGKKADKLELDASKSSTSIINNETSKGKPLTTTPEKTESEIRIKDLSEEEIVKVKFDANSKQRLQ